VTDRAALLDYADDLLDGTVPMGVRGPRVAALLARRAFEDWLDEQSGWAAGLSRRPTTNSKLVVLGVKNGDDVGDAAKRIWHGLSRACHRHSYELHPSPAEVRGLVAALRALDDV
jgi:hypothetical protein